MVVNSKYKFIFVHIPKAAGTSISKNLKKAPGNKNKWLAKTKHETLSDFYFKVSDRRTFTDKILKLNPENYYTFGFVRNPWDRILSLYQYLKFKKPIKEIETIDSFQDFLFQAKDGVDWIKNLSTMRPQADYFTFDNGSILINFLGHYEYLQEDLSKISKEIGLSINIKHLNKSKNSHLDYRNIYETKMVDIVKDLFIDDVNLFSYEFEKPYPNNRISGQFSR